MNNDATEFDSIMHKNLRRKKVGLEPLRFLPFLGITMGVLILMAMAAPSARAALLTYYDFEDQDLVSDSPGLQNTNLKFTAAGGLEGGTGTTMNAVTTPSTNTALALLPTADTTDSVTFGGLTTTGFGTDVNLSFAIKGGGTGAFTTLDLFYSTNGGANYSLLAIVFDLTSLTSYKALSFAAPAADGVSGGMLFFEFSFSGGNPDSSATFIDNIQVTAVPEPSSYIGALVGVLGLCWIQRRRFMRLLSLRAA